MNPDAVSLISELGVPLGYTVILTGALAYVYKYQMKTHEQAREDNIEREKVLTQCFQNVSKALEKIDITMREAMGDAKETKEIVKDLRTRVCEIQGKVG